MLLKSVEELIIAQELSGNLIPGKLFIKIWWRSQNCL